jgi:coenzyme F420 biosynthesis associated uncharacterized protein
MRTQRQVLPLMATRVAGMAGRPARAPGLRGTAGGGRSPVPDRAFGAGVVTGTAVGLGVAWLNGRVHRVAAQGLVDWHRAERLAGARLRRAPGALSPAEIEATAPAYDEAMRRVVPALESALGSPLPGVVERHAVVDRAGWASANLDVFRVLYGKLEAALGEGIRPREGSLGEGLAALTNRFVATQEVGFLLGYMGSRVLGQYDIALLSAEARPGQLLFVEENIRSTAAALHVPIGDFRTWVALHEATHAFEFEAHPWLRAYLADRLERQLQGFVEDARLLQVEGLARLVRRWRAPARGGLIEGLLVPEQRRLFRETQVVMSLLEGFGDWVMDRVGVAFLPDVADMRRRFEERRSAPRRGLDRVISRLIGMDLKLEQYRRGERFVAGVAAVGGADAVARLWDGPEALPTERELVDPGAWVRRVVGQPA